MANTPTRHLRIPDDEWADWQEHAEAAGVSVTELVRVRMNGRPPIVAVHPATLEPVEPLAEIDPAEFVVTPTPMAPKPKRQADIPEGMVAHGVTVEGKAIDARPCRHPRSARDAKGYVTICSKDKGGCGARL